MPLRRLSLSESVKRKVYEKGVSDGYEIGWTLGIAKQVPSGLKWESVIVQMRPFVEKFMNDFLDSFYFNVKIIPWLEELARRESGVRASLRFSKKAESFEDAFEELRAEYLTGFEKGLYKAIRERWEEGKIRASEDDWLENLVDIIAPGDYLIEVRGEIFRVKA